MGGPADGGVPYFFLSYAHGEDDDDARVHQFFHDLCVEIRLLAGLRRGTVVGFHDHGTLRAGDDWRRELLTALGEARTLVALWSPRYFTSEFCGAEWTAFHARMRNGGAALQMIPVIWVWCEIPEALSHVQYQDLTFGAAYARHGLRNLILDGGGAPYHVVVQALARRITQRPGGPGTSTQPSWADSWLPAGVVPDPRAPLSTGPQTPPPRRPILSLDHGPDNPREERELP